MLRFAKSHFIGFTIFSKVILRTQEFTFILWSCRMCLNSHISYAFSIPWHIICTAQICMEVHVDNISILVYLSVCYLMSVLVAIFWFPQFLLIYVILPVLRHFQKIFWWQCADSLCVPVPFENLSAEWWWYQIFLTVLGTTHELLHLWINTCSIKTEKTEGKIVSHVFHFFAFQKFLYQTAISLQNFILIC